MGKTKRMKLAISKQSANIEKTARTRQYSDQSFIEALELILACYCMEDSPEKLKKRRIKIGQFLSELGITSYLTSIAEDLIRQQLPMRFVDNTCLENKILAVTTMLLGIFHNYTDASANFSAVLVKSETFILTVKSALQELESDYLQKCLISEAEELVRSIMTIVYNLFLHDKVDVFENKHLTGMVDVVKPYLKSHTEIMRATALFLIVYLVDEKQAQEVCADGQCLPYTLNCLKQAKSSEERRHDGWSVSELLRVLARLSALDVNKKKLGELDAISLMATLLKDGSAEEKSAALKILWQLSFEVENAKRIRDGRLAEVIQALAKDSSSPDLQRQANGILWNLEGKLDQPLKQDQPRSAALIERRQSQTRSSVDKTDARPARSRPSPASQSGGHIMISYEKATLDIVTRIKDYLTSHEQQVWMNTEGVVNHYLDDTAVAIEKAWLVLIVVSRRYKDDALCRREAEYTTQLKKRIIPLKIGSYDPDGWLGIIIAGKIYIKFGNGENDEQFDRLCAKLLKDVNQIRSELNRH